MIEGFAPRYLNSAGPPARLLKHLQNQLSPREWQQLLFLYTCRAHPILADFVREVHWSAYATGQSTLSNEQARTFVTRATQDGKTVTPWSEGTMRRVAGYLTGCCADFGLLDSVGRTERRILPYRLEPTISTLLAYDLHWQGIGDNQLLDHTDWALFGLASHDVLDELRRLALQGLLMLQAAGGIVRIEWLYPTHEDLIDAISQR